MLITVHDIIEKCKFYTENENKGVKYVAINCYIEIISH